MARNLKKTRTRKRGLRRKVNHERRIQDELRIQFNQLINGMILMFNYPGSYDKEPLILFLYKDNKLDIVHGINLNYMHEPIVQRLFNEITKLTSIEVTKDKFKKGRKFTIVNIDDPRNKNPLSPKEFYDNLIKPIIYKMSGDNIYRTYKMSKMSNMRMVNYKLDVIEKEIRSKYNIKHRDVTSSEINKSFNESDESIEAGDKDAN